MEAFFNRRFEFYGRRIRLIPRSVPQDGGDGDRSAARGAYEQDQAFASTGCGDYCDVYADEVAYLRIVGVHHVLLFAEQYLASRRPYLWQYPMANNRVFAIAGDWFCSRLGGRNAVHSGDPLLQATRRKPGIILTDAHTEGTSAEPMNEQLAACGARTDVVLNSRAHGFNAEYYAGFFENAMLQMKTSGVTTVVCLCQVLAVSVAMRAATNQGYFPEWLLSDYIDNGAGFYVRSLLPAEQTKSLMMLSAYPMHRPYADHPSNWALHETSNRGRPTTASDQYLLDLTYQALLLLASGLQMAGPHLTPETFERGLHRATFPNPAHRIMAGAVGFGDGDHTMTDDTAELWWSNTAQSPYDDGPGAFCYVDHGSRRRIGEFPTDDPFFAGPCDSGTA